MNKISILEILLVSFLLLSPIIAGYFGWRVFKLNKRVKLLQEHRNELIHSRAQWEVDMLEIKKKKVVLDDLEKKMILNALKMPEFKGAIDEPSTHHHVRKAYKELKDKIKVSFSD